MTHLDTLRHMLAVRPCGRHCGCGGCQERAALEEAIRVMTALQDAGAITLDARRYLERDAGVSHEAGRLVARIDAALRGES